MLAPGANRRSSIVDPGPITRPLAPIARPTTGDTGSGSASPVRRSPSPKGVLGSSALAADDDEVVSAAGRRLMTGGQIWGGAPSPRTSVDVRVPWGPPAPGFPAPTHSPRPPAGGSPWTTPHPDWHPSNFFPTPFVTHNSSPPPHSGN